MASHYERWGDNLLNAKLMLLVLIGVLTALHVITPYTRAVSIAVFLASIGIVWLGVAYPLSPTAVARAHRAHATCTGGDIPEQRRERSWHPARHDDTGQAASRTSRPETLPSSTARCGP